MDSFLQKHNFIKLIVGDIENEHGLIIIKSVETTLNIQETTTVTFIKWVVSKVQGHKITILYKPFQRIKK